MENGNNMNRQGAGHWLPRLVLPVFFTVLVTLSTACSTKNPIPGVLEWHTLGDSPYRATIALLLKEDLDSAVGYGWNPMDEYYIAHEDINDDGLVELFVTTGIPSISGVEGSWIGLYTQAADGDWKEILYILITHYSPRILPTKTNGFHDLAAWNSLVTYEDGLFQRSGDVDPGELQLGEELSPQNLLPHIWDQCCSKHE